MVSVDTRGQIRGKTELKVVRWSVYRHKEYVQQPMVKFTKIKLRLHIHITPLSGEKIDEKIRYKIGKCESHGDNKVPYVWWVLEGETIIVSQHMLCDKAHHLKLKQEQAVIPGLILQVVHCLGSMSLFSSLTLNLGNCPFTRPTPTYPEAPTPSQPDRPIVHLSLHGFEQFLHF